VTLRTDLETLLEVAGPARQGRQIGIVHFENAYFHPKTIHLTRTDGSELAYVGSANLTGSGVQSLHIEAGVAIDTREGDNAAVVAAIRGAVDWWFEHPRDGLHPVSGVEDLQHLVDIGVLNVPPPPLPRRQVSPGRAGARLAPLVSVPPVLSASFRDAHSIAPEGTPTQAAVAEAFPPLEVAPVATWAKPLTISDAQRKATGNQRGSITLVKAGHPIDAQTYFRFDFFASAAWTGDRTRTGEARERADIPFAVEVLGRDLGVLVLPVTYAVNRESSQANYTTLLHLGALAPQFASHDMTRRSFRITRLADDTFSLLIS
jgi:hypothetical protein